MTKQNKTNIFILIFTLATLAIVIYYVFYKKNSSSKIFTCSSSVHVIDRTNSTSVDKINHLFYYPNGTGLRTERGTIDIKSKRYFLDRDIHFKYINLDHNGIISVEFTKLYKRPHDNAPDNIWGAESQPGTKYYFTINEIGPGIYLFNERDNPVTICSSY